jgi:hypothetical protein
VSRLLPGKEGEGEENEDERETGMCGVTADGATVQPLPLQLIERNRLTPEQIKKLPRFANYSPGNPSSVSGVFSHVISLAATGVHRSYTSRTFIAKLPLTISQLFLVTGKMGCGLKSDY